ncbi:MAG: type II toxin-antitoxin system RelE/ParE family toxin [Cytophagales bacterium]
MAFQLQYFDEVEADIHNAKTWYKEQKDGLEIEFATAIEKAINQILETPKAYSVRYKKIRIAHPKKFPYNIHFYIDEPNNTVIITAIVHSKRNAQNVKKRL